MARRAGIHAAATATAPSSAMATICDSGSMRRPRRAGPAQRGRRRSSFARSLVVREHRKRACDGAARMVTQWFRLFAQLWKLRFDNVHADGEAAAGDRSRETARGEVECNTQGERDDIENVALPRTLPEAVLDLLVVLRDELLERERDVFRVVVLPILLPRPQPPARRSRSSAAQS